MSYALIGAILLGIVRGNASGWTVAFPPGFAILFGLGTRKPAG